MNNSLGINIAKLVTSKVGAQTIMIITAPIFTRLYLPDAFGVRQIFVSIAGIIIVVSCLRYELSIPLGKDEKEAIASLALSLLFTLVFTIAALAVVPFLRGIIARRFNAPELKGFLWLLPAIVFLGGLTNSLNYWASREGRFGAMAWSGFGSSLVTSLVIMAWALIIGGTMEGLFVGYLAGMILGVIVLLLFLSRKIMSDIKDAQLDFVTIRTVAKQHRKFPIFSTWSILFNNVSHQLPPLILGLYFPMTIVGYYSLGHRLVSLPMVLLGNSIAQVFLPAASKEYNETGNLSGIVSIMFERLAQFGVFPMVVLLFLGGQIFGFLFGQEWREAGTYAQILSAYVLLQFVSSPLSKAFCVMQRQGTSLAVSIALLAGRTLALLAGTRVGGSRVALGSYTLVNILCYGYVCYWVLRNSNLSLRWGIGTLGKYVGASGLLLLPAVSLAFLGRSIYVIFLAVALAVCIYVYALCRSSLGFLTFVRRT